MRTTLTLDDDVAVLVRRALKSSGSTLKELVNDALRRALGHAQSSKPRKSFRTRTFNPGPCLIGSLEKTSEVLEHLEGRGYRDTA